LHVLTQTEEDCSPSRVFEDMRQLLPADAVLWCKPMYLVRRGNPVEEITRASRQVGADLIVLAMTRPDVLADHAHWATASRVVAEAKIPVLIVRDHL
jgi:nucleotide-binding universal stress UspA family protein